MVAASVAFFLAELGDKTMLATITLVTKEGALGTWAGSTLGMIAADAPAFGVGKMLGSRLPDKAIGSPPPSPSSSSPPPCWSRACGVDQAAVLW